MTTATIEIQENPARERRRVTVQCSSTQRQFLGAIFDRAILGEDSPYDVIGFGGARGGGKTFASALAAVLLCQKFPRIKGLLLRRGLAAAVNNFRDEIRKILRKLRCSKSVRWLSKEKIFRFGNGAELHLGFAASERDYEQYQGVQWDFIGFEEGTQHPAEAWDTIGASSRPNNPAMHPVRWITCNPGGKGHAWIKERFVDKKTRRAGHLWIPSTIYDNPALMLADPGYVRRVLDPLPEWQRKQWRDGDWDAIAGQYWTIAPDVIRTVDVPRHADWYAGVDWGKAKPFAVIYLARWQEWMFHPNTGQWFPLDRAHIAREIYQPNLDLDEQADVVRDTEKTLPLNGKEVLYYADPATGKEREVASTEAGETIRSTWITYGLFTLPAKSNARVPGWNLMKMLLREHPTPILNPDGTRYMHRILTIDPSCVALLQEMTGAVAEGAPGPPISEDMKQGPLIPDHAEDAARYVVVSTFGLGYEVPKPDAYLTTHQPGGARDD